MLLNLANSESHNITSEVLLRAASGTWDSVLSADKLYEWIKNKGIDTRNITIKDGSGLSRGNITTTRALANTLFLMNNHKHKEYFISSMSLLGVRGTLREVPVSYNSYDKFFGKSGTLEGVRSITGYLNLSNKKKYI